MALKLFIFFKCCSLFYDNFFFQISFKSATPLKTSLIKKSRNKAGLKNEYVPVKNYFLSTCSSETVSLCLPFFLLLAKTLRPFAVSMRLRKPCTLLRRRLCGWYVLFLPGIVLNFFLYKLIIIVSATGHHS